jgi:aminomuconate-semialdehyde/2-hydroxymuconate-6-semialdehyde dehydrogenase
MDSGDEKAAKVVRLRHQIGGMERDAEEGGWLEVRAPATGQIWAEVARGGPRDVDAAVEAANVALSGPWGRMGASERAAILERAADILESKATELAKLESRDQGKPASLAARMDIPRSVANLRFFAGAVRHDETPCHTTPGLLNYTLRKPVGVAALITPWNLPLYLLTWKVGPALALGNVVVAKPSELSPATACALGDALREAGLPAGAFNLVHGLGPEVGAPLVAHPGVNLVSFTGGTATGRQVAATAASSFKKLSLELGGKNATLVFADAVATEADLERVVKGTLRAAFANQGEICLCGSRLLVERSAYDRFVARFLEEMAKLRTGPEADADLGALISAAHRDKVEYYLGLARAEGGVVVGGKRPDLPAPNADGYFLEPAVILGLSPQCRSAQEEIFGPVVSIHAFDSDADAVTIANGVRYGLAASIWTNRLDRAHAVAAALETGMVWINCWLERDLRVPFGGVKDSGVGREGGAWSLDFYSEVKNVGLALPR